jgi:tape measure domain-containing protein
MDNDKVVITFVGKDEVTPAANKVDQAVKKTGKTAKSSASDVDSLTGGFDDLKASMGALGITAVVGGIISIGKAVWDASVNAALFYDKMENVRMSLGNLLDSKEAGDALYKTMQDIAQRTPFTFEDVATTTQRLLAMGFAAEQIPATFDAIGNAASATGAGAEGVNRIALALGQMQAKGKITTEEMMQLQEVGVPAFRILAEATGVSQQALMKMVSDGIVPANQNLDTLIAAMNSNYGGAMAQQLGTATQAQSNLNDAVDNFNTEIGEATSPHVIAFYLLATKTLYGFAASVHTVNEATRGLTRAQQQKMIDDKEWWGNFLKGIAATQKLQFGQGIIGEWLLSEAEALKLTTGAYDGYANGAASAAQAGDGLTKAISGTNSSLGVTALVTTQATNATKGKSTADKEAADAQKELEQNTKKYEDVLKSLRGSYMNIADAQRSVESAQKDLADAMDPSKVASMNLAIQSQAIDMRELNQSMADMKKRREEIAKALASQNTEQIRHNALTADERRQLSGINANLTSQRQERDAIRKALKEGNLTAEQRVEFLATEQALTASINQQAGQKRTLEEKQNAAVKKAQEDRISLIEEDKRLQADLEKSQIRAKQAIIDMQTAQKALAEAQDPKRLEAYRDAVTKAEQNLATLRTEQEANKITADNLAASIGVTSGSVEALRQSAADTATPLDDMGVGLDTVTSSLNKPNGFNTTASAAGGALKKITEYADSSKAGLAGFNTVLSKLPDTKGKADSLSAVADAMERIAVLFPAFDDGMFIGVQQITNAINGITNDGSSRWNSFSINFSAALKNATPSAIKNLVEALAAVNTAPGDLVAYSTKAELADAIKAFANDGRLTSSEYSSLTVGKTAAELAYIHALIRSYGDKIRIDPDVPGAGTLFGSRSRLGASMGGTGQFGTGQQATDVGQVPTVQNITINLNYATPPSSDDPLGDVKRYIAAQGGRLRI